MHQMNSEMQQCIENCQKCHATCLQHAMNHCLDVGGKHIEPNHFKLMMACAEICQTAANFMLIGTPRHQHVCAECAEICEECAVSCEAVGDMEECVEVCRTCAASCDMIAAKE